MKQKKQSIPKTATAKKISKLKAEAPAKNPTRIFAPSPRPENKITENILSAAVESTGKKIESFAKDLQRLTKKLTPKMKALAEQAEPIVKKVRRAARKKILSIPAILLESDIAAPPSATGPGQRYALGPTPPGPDFSEAENLGDLPEAYG
ncbi:MAG: hypothetical protein ACR2H1_02775, partial [Limisphaerales bacterium]